MAVSDSTIRTVLEPEDEHPHQPDDSPNYNESVYQAMTRYHCNGLTGIGTSEYLDQVVAGWPTGPDVPNPARREEVAS